VRPDFFLDYLLDVLLFNPWSDFVWLASLAILDTCVI
jgi:hypothetical protein